MKLPVLGILFLSLQLGFHSQAAVTPAGSVEISASIDSYNDKVAIFDGQVELHYQNQSVFCDHLIYNRSTKTLTATGNVRIFDGSKLYRAEHAIYSLNTKEFISS